LEVRHGAVELPWSAGQQCRDHTGSERNVATHVIDPVTMVADDYAGFVAARQQALLSLISSAMGKPAQLD
jgi:hypothetical protein